MTLTTERLSFENVTMNDLEKIHELHSLPETDRFNTLGIPASIEVTGNLLHHWIELNQLEPKIKYTFSLFHKDTNAFVGLFGINVGKPNYSSAEIWYKFHYAHWNKGYATEAVEEVLRFCFKELGLHRIEAGCAVENTASIKVLEKCGFTREGRKRKKLPIRGEWIDNYFYAILEEDFNQKNNKDFK